MSRNSDAVLIELAQFGWVWKDRSRDRQRLARDFDEAWSFSKTGRPQPKDQLVDATARQLVLIEELLQFYVVSDPGEQRRMRAAVSGHPSLSPLLLAVARRYAEHGSPEKPIDCFRLALAAVSLEDCATDFRDVLQTLGDVWQAIDAAGQDPRTRFDEASGWSETVSSKGGDMSTAERFLTFEKSSYLKYRIRTGHR